MSILKLKKYIISYWGIQNCSWYWPQQIFSCLVWTWAKLMKIHQLYDLCVILFYKCCSFTSSRFKNVVCYGRMLSKILRRTRDAFKNALRGQNVSKIRKELHYLNSQSYMQEWMNLIKQLLVLRKIYVVEMKNALKAKRA